MLDPTGHSSIPNAILADMPNMSAPEMACTLVLAAATYGRRRHQATLTYADFQEHTMFGSDQTITKALTAVAGRGFFRRTGRSTWEIMEPALSKTFPAARANEEAFFSDPGRSQQHQAPREPNPAASDLDTAPIEAHTSPIEVQTSPSEARTSLSEAHTSFSEAHTSFSEAHTSFHEAHTSLSEAHTSFYEEERPPESAPEAKDGTKTEPPARSDGTETEPLPFIKEKDLLTRDLERERKRARARDETAPSAEPASPLSKIPRPRTPEEKILAEHPATRTWLASGLAWPGWVRLRAITRRIGHEPQADKLQRAYEMWLMHGYRPDNIQGILDWYQALCRDDQWQPYQQPQPPAGHTHNAGSQPQEGLEMLLRMREERLNEQRHDSGLCDHAAVRLSTHQDQQGNHAHL